MDAALQAPSTARPAVRTYAVLRSLSARLYRLAPCGFDAVTGEVFFLAYLGPFSAPTWSQPVPAAAVRAARAAGRLLEGLTEEQAAEMTRRTKAPTAPQDRAPVRRGTPVRARSLGAALHRDLAVGGIGDHYTFASDALGRPVTSLGALSRDDVQAVYAALDALTYAL